MADLHSEIRNELTQRIIPFWHGLRDEANGGFIGRVEFDLTRRPEADKGCILNSRILWFFSEAYMALKDDPHATGDERALVRQTRLVGYDYDTTFFSNMNAGASDDLLYSLGNIDKTFSNEVYESILADSEEKCVELFNKYIADLEAMGLKDLEAFWNANYQAYLAIAK